MDEGKQLQGMSSLRWISPIEEELQGVQTCLSHLRCGIQGGAKASLVDRMPENAERKRSRPGEVQSREALVEEGVT